MLKLPWTFTLAIALGLTFSSAGPLHDNASCALPAFRQCLADAGVNVDLRYFEYNPDSHSQYADFNYQWEMIGAVRNPAAYFLPQDATDVQRAVRCGKPLGVPLVPKGGGHSYEKYSFTHATGEGDERAAVILDLQRLDQLTVTARAAEFSVGAGALLSQIAWPLYDVHELVTPHGTCPTVGIGGLALGGGYGYLSRMYGLTTDSILELELVDAEGELRTVNRNSNSDLFWALKGAGPGSFGVVTQLRMKAYEPPKLVVIGTASYPKEEFPAVFLAWQRFLLRNPPREINSKFAVNNGRIIIEIFEVQIEEGQGGWGDARIRAYFSDFPSTPQLQMRQYNYMDFLMKTMHSTTYGVTHPSQFPSLTRHSNSPKRFKAKSFFVEHEIGAEGVATLAGALESIPVEKDMILELYQFGGAISDPENVAVSSFVHREGVLFLVQAFYEWRPSTGAMEIEDSLEWLRQFYRIAKDVTGSRSSYQNYADAELDDYLGSYYGSALPRLLDIKRAVDPGNYFRGPQTIPLRN